MVRELILNEPFIFLSTFYYHKTLKGICGLQIDNRNVFRAVGHKTENLRVLFCRPINYNIKLQ